MSDVAPETVSGLGAEGLGVETQPAGAGTMDWGSPAEAGGCSLLGDRSWGALRAALLIGPGSVCTTGRPSGVSSDRDEQGFGSSLT